MLIGLTQDDRIPFGQLYLPLTQLRNDPAQSQYLADRFYILVQVTEEFEAGPRRRVERFSIFLEYIGNAPKALREVIIAMMQSADEKLGR